MPLSTQIVRNGESLPKRWGDFHIAAMVLAAAFDSGKGPFEKSNSARKAIKDRRLARRYPTEPLPITRGTSFQLASYPIIGTTPLNEGSYTLKNRHHFIDETDGEVLELLPGDVLVAYRT
jgi:hypothetical protein